MMHQEDWLMRQIGSLIRIIRKLILKEDSINYEIVNQSLDTETDLLHKQLIQMLKTLKINEAEDLLFKSIKTHDLNYLKIAVDFYERLNRLSDEELEKSDFSRDEIKSGLEDICKIFGVPVWK